MTSIGEENERFTISEDEENTATSHTRRLIEDEETIDLEANNSPPILNSNNDTASRSLFPRGTVNDRNAPNFAQRWRYDYPLPRIISDLSQI